MCQGKDPSDALQSARALLARAEARGSEEFVDADGASVQSSALLTVEEVQEGDVCVTRDRHGVGAPSVEVATIGPPLEDHHRPAAAWHDQDAADRWIQAIESIAERERQDRGVDKAASVTSSHGHLWARYGKLRVTVAGPTADIHNETELFEYVDRWVAFQLIDDASRLLERDRDYIAQWRARLSAERHIWERAAAVVFADVDPTMSGYQHWRIELVEDERYWPRAHHEGDDVEVSHRSSHTMYFTPPGWEAPEPTRRPLLLPHLALHIDSNSTNLFVGSPKRPLTTEAAIETIAEWLQDAIIEDTRHAWPRCPRHEHPLDLDGTTWTCPTDDAPVAEVGHLRNRQ
jgi:hypothetical protein